MLRRDLADKVGGFNPAFDGSQDYDLVLRASEQARAFSTFPKCSIIGALVLASTASGIENKSYAIDAARRALQAYCDRSQEGGIVEQGSIAGRWSVRYPVGTATRVSIIIAAGGKVDVLRANLDSLFAKTSYANYEVVIADNSKGHCHRKAGQSISKQARQFALSGLPQPALQFFGD